MCMPDCIKCCFDSPQEKIKTITDQEGQRLQKLVEETIKEERETSKVRPLKWQTIFRSFCLPSLNDDGNFHHYERKFPHFFFALLLQFRRDPQALEKLCAGRRLNAGYSDYGSKWVNGPSGLSACWRLILVFYHEVTSFEKCWSTTRSLLNY